jgi:inner membrane protein
MPSPVGHALAGLTVHVLTAHDRVEATSLERLLLVVGAAVAPDLDLFGRLVDGQNHHQQEFHSVGFAILAGLVAAFLARARGLRPAATGVAAGLGYVSHIVLDYLAVDTSPPIGLMALWPLSSAYLHFPRPIFMDIWRTLEWKTVRHDSLAVLWEIAILTPVLLVAWRARSFGKGGFRWHGGLKASR